MPNFINTIIIDSDKKSTIQLKLLLEKHYSNIKLLGIASTIDNAIKLIDKTKPDLVFLEIDLQGEQGFDILKKVNYKMFDVIITTNNSKHAVNAFNFSILDYIQKPYKLDTLKKAILRYKDLYGNFKSDIGIIKKSKHDYERLILPVHDGVELIDVDLITMCEAENDKTIFHLANGNLIVVEKPFDYYEDVLSDLFFIKVHKNTIINIDYIHEHKQDSESEYIVLKDDSIVKIRNLKQEIIEVN